jgi:GT2 family glycosyltransferase
MNVTANNTLAPIVLFVYNRPEHTRKTVEGLLLNPEAKESTIYIFADGPKKSISKDGLEKLKATREYIHTINGFKEIIVDESEKNRGLANATIRGCSKVIEKHGRMIMIEDDDIPTPFFLKYMNDCLDKFENDNRVWAVCGYTDAKSMPPQDGDEVFFVNRPSSWGVGTWKRCWDKIIWDKDILRGIFQNKSIIKGFDRWGGKDHSMIMDDLLNERNYSTPQN